MEVKDKVILITGASGGIGSALARLLAGKGAMLALMSRNIKNLNKLKEELGDNAIFVSGDVGDEKSAEKAVKDTLSHFKKLDVLINNAGSAYHGSIERMDMGAFDSMMKTNVYGVINMIQYSLPYLKKTKGMVVNISSVASKRAIPMLGAYSASKSMVDALSDALRVETMGYGIRVLNFCPPEVDTDFARNAVKERGIDFEAQKNLRRVMTLKPEKVARMIVSGIEKEKREIVAMKSIQPANYFMPGILDKLFYKFIMKPYKDKYSS